MSTSTSTQLPVPAHFDPTKVGEIWRVPYRQRATDAREWARSHGLQPAARDRTRVALLLVDVQNTFCLPGSELPVAGAVDDNVRLCQFIYRNLGVITAIHLTLDTHMAMQIFHPVFWVDESGEHPEPATVISLQDVEAGRWKVNAAVAESVGGGDYARLQKHAHHYARELSEGGKYPLIIWPYHAMLGGVGHALVASVEEACFFHNMARSSQTGFEIKGGNPLTENYSVLRPEILDGLDGTPIAQKNTRFLETLLGFDVVIIAGQAKSHCVTWTINDLLSEITERDVALAAKVYLLEDCTSPVIIPGVVDFTEQANEAFQRFADAGLHPVKSTAPIKRWPDISL